MGPLVKFRISPRNYFDLDHRALLLAPARSSAWRNRSLSLVTQCYFQRPWFSALKESFWGKEKTAVIVVHYVDLTRGVLDKLER